MEHLVYCDDKAKVLNKIWDGSKTMVVRGAAGRKIPHSRVNEGETLYFMQKGSKRISAKGVRFINEPMDMPDWGTRVVHLYDPKENLVELFTPLKPERLASGDNVEQRERKTKNNR